MSEYDVNALQLSRRHAGTSATTADYEEPVRSHGSAVKQRNSDVYQFTDHTEHQPRVQRASRMRTQTTVPPSHRISQRSDIVGRGEKIPHVRQQRKSRFWLWVVGWHPAIKVLVFLIALCIGYFTFTAAIHDLSNQATYGYPRTYQTDKDVGHGGVSHFTVENLHGHILITEIPADPSTSHIYVGPTIIGLVGILGLFNTLTISVLERRREIGILRSMGATGGKIARVFWTEGMALSLIAWGVAAIISIPVAYGFVSLISSVLVPIPFAFAPGALVTMLALIVVIATIASFGPALSAAQVRVSNTLRYE